MVVPRDPFLIALASAVPGAGRPSEMWIRVPDASREAAVRETLADDPFRFPVVTARSDLIAERTGDPLARAIVWTLVVAALAGLALSLGGLVLGTVTDLRDERGELADLEAQGVTPSDLRWHALARTAWLAIGGALAGVVVGLVLTVVVTRALSLTAEGVAPIPPLAVVIPWATIVGIVVGVLVIVLGAAAILTRRSYGARTLGERRANRATTPPAPPTLRPREERADG